MLVLSAIVPVYIIGMALGAGVFGMFMLTEGFFVILKNLPKWYIWSYYIGFHTYTFEMFMYNEFHGLEIDCEGSTSCRYPDGQAVLVEYQMENVNMRADIGILITQMILYRLIFYCVLKFIHKGRK